MLSLIDWRREIFEIYSDIRTESDGKIAWENGGKREELFKHHPESPTLISKVYLELCSTNFISL